MAHRSKFHQLGARPTLGHGTGGGSAEPGGNVLIGNFALFGATGETAEIVLFFCMISGPMWLFVGALFVANAAFNNLGFASHSTIFNWGRATIGTLPFCWLGVWQGRCSPM